MGLHDVLGLSVIPSLTVAFMSFNRLHYLKALVDSFLVCCGIRDTQLIVADGGSTEPGMATYLGQHFGGAEVFSAPCSYAEAINEVVRRARGRFLLILSDDHQFVRKTDADWLGSCMRLLDQYPWIESIGFDAQRQVTMEKFFQRSPRKWFTRRLMDEDTGEVFYTYGPWKSGFSGSGLNAFMRTALWREMGPARTSPRHTGAWDALLGQEDEMLARYRLRHPFRQLARMQLPALMEITADPGGFPAKVRDGKRWGAYFPPPQGRFYFDFWYTNPWVSMWRGPRPVSYEEALGAATPIGWRPALDERGKLRKGNPVLGVTLSEPLR